jgi:uncharacterized protein (DUF58 family)
VILKPATSAEPATSTERTYADDLLPPSLLRKLERMRLVSRRPMRGQVLGSRRSMKHGASVEFSDFRDYSAGDDLRYVDWKAYGRLEKLYVKLFREEDDLSVHLLFDTSQSMDFGEPVTKLFFGKQLCAALGAIALMAFDRCSITALSESGSGRAPTLRGRGSVTHLFRHLSSLRAQGQSSVASALMRYAQAVSAPGVLVIVSDFYEHGLTRALLARASRRLDVVLVHVVSPEELDPGLNLGISGDVRLVDSETQSTVELTLTPGVLQAYRARFEAFSADLERVAKSAGAGYVRVSTDDSLEEIVLGTLARRRIVRAA